MQVTGNARGNAGVVAHPEMGAPPSKGVVHDTSIDVCVIDETVGAGEIWSGAACTINTKVARERDSMVTGIGEADSKETQDEESRTKPQSREGNRKRKLSDAQPRPKAPSILEAARSRANGRTQAGRF